MERNGRLRRGDLAGRLGGWAIALACAALPARADLTPEQLKQQFAALLGSGKYARIVWERGKNSNESYIQDSVDTQIMALDTKDGVIRQVTTDKDFPKGHGHLTFASITPDGQKITFFNRVDLTVWVVNWDGSGLKRLVSGYYSSNTWRGQGKNWVIVSKRNADHLGPCYRVDVEDPNDKALLWDKSDVGSVEFLDWQTLSLDGTRMAGTFPHPGAGLAAVPDGAVNRFQGDAAGACWPSTCKGNNEYQVMWTPGDHFSIRVSDKDGKEIGKYPTTKVIGGSPFNMLRWSNDPDIISFNNGHGEYGWNQGPNYIVRLSDMESVNPNQGRDEYNGITDILVYRDGDITTALRASFRPAPAPPVDAAFNALGIRIRTPGPDAHGPLPGTGILFGPMP